MTNFKKLYIINLSIFMKHLLQNISSIWRNPVTLAFILFLFLQLQVFNIHMDFRDEGFLTYNAVRIKNGEIPYRDFFLTTTPGTFYIQAFLMNIFGDYLIIARILNILIILGILLLVSRIFQFKSYLDYLLLSLLSLEFISPAYAFYNIEGLLLFLLCFYLIRKKPKKQFLYYALLGLITAFMFLIKQSYGLAGIAAIVLSFYIYKDKNWLKNSLIYLAGFGMIMLLYILYLVYNNALNEFIYYVFYFSREVKSHRAPFIITSIMFIPVYFIATYILKKATLKQKIYIFSFFIPLSFILYLIISPSRIGRLFTIIYDPLIYYYLAFLLIPLTVISLNWKKSGLKELLSISCFTLALFFASASSGRDYTTVLMLSPFFLPLCISFIRKTTVIHHKSLVTVAVLLIYTLPFLLSSAKTLKNASFYNSYISNIKEAKGIKMPREEARELEMAVSYIKSSVSVKERIICFPYCPLIFVLSQRSSGSYFSFFYPETFRATDQDKTIRELKLNRTKMAIIQRRGNIEPEANYEDKRLKILRNYLVTHYKLVKETNNFYFYLQK